MCQILTAKGWEIEMLRQIIMDGVQVGALRQAYLESELKGEKKAEKSMVQGVV